MAFYGEGLMPSSELLLSDDDDEVSRKFHITSVKAGLKMFLLISLKLFKCRKPVPGMNHIMFSFCILTPTLEIKCRKLNFRPSLQCFC